MTEKDEQLFMEDGGLAGQTNRAQNRKGDESKDKVEIHRSYVNM
jgi:hypothetical protein